MKQLLIGDCHFGVKGNSLIWLTKQIEFFKKQVIPVLDENPDIRRVVFLGDLMDIRYAVNQQIGYEVKALLMKMFIMFKNIEFVFICGNHDLYSPDERFVMYNCYNTMFGIYGDDLKNVYFVTESPRLLKDGCLFLPWWWTENTDHFDELLYSYDFKDDVRCVFCHTDLSRWPGARTAALNGVPVYSGHIHNEWSNLTANLYNLGAAFAFTFNDVDQDRYIYILDDDFKISEKIQNTVTWKFRQCFNEDIFSLGDDDFENTYMRLCISQSNMRNARYIDQIKYLRSQYINANMSLYIIDDDIAEQKINDTGDNIQTKISNINNYISDSIPSELKQKYDILYKEINK